MRMKVSDYNVFVFEADGHAAVIYGRDETPEFVWAKRFHRDSRGPLFAFLKRFSDMPATKMIVTGASKTEAVELANAQRKALQRDGVKIVGQPASKLSKRAVIWNSELYFKSTVEAARFFKLHHGTIQNYCNDTENSTWRWAE